MLEHERYRIATDFRGGYAIEARTEGIWHQVARYDDEGGESFDPSVTQSQMECIRRFASQADIL